ncbi:class I adenylate-forming enzyme family protein [Robertmurraya kyonggiensis]|uniref:Acyl--CoA ligase n=1 Tax=Robertmurraya kyonggiensis TaxID=1037680 RepID=A0A4U1D9A1_9BACI|nr:class I adenylate-forming enzyme family protein [Robertmurraya kyonggiensis]TKC19119.1 acyl--CoA ligase [Robertmurraya kyonggiensis]
MEKIHHILDKMAEENPSKLAIITNNNSITYGELVKKSHQAANFFLKENIKNGDRVLLKLNNRIELIYLLYGLSRVSAIAVIISPDTTDYNVNYILEDCKPSLFIYEENFALTNFNNKKINTVISEIEKSSNKFIQNETDSDETILLIYTSGSTGKPKAVVSNHKNIIFCTKEIARELSLVKSDIIGNFLPFSFDYGLYQVFLSNYSGCTLALGSWENAGIEILKYIKNWHVTVFPSLPHLTKGLIKMIERSGELSQLTNLRAITNTGEKLHSNIYKKIIELIPNCGVYLMYGLTECKRVSILKPEEHMLKPDSVGRPLKGTECYVVDNEGNKLPHNNIGELIVSGPNVMQGYWNNSNLTNKSYFINSDGQKVLKTGDFFKIDSEGYLYFIGRIDSQFKQRGFRISPLEIEEAAYKLDFVEEAALIPPDDHYNHSTLFIQSSEDRTKKEIYNELKIYLEEYKLPTEVIVTPKLPATINGKINKIELRRKREKLNVRL